MVSLFKGKLPAVISVKVAAEYIGVSTATVRNWIRQGYLEVDDSKQIIVESLRRFYEDRVGHEKLNSRANKQHKLDARKLTESQEWGEYECSLSDSHRNKEGVYYTPDVIVVDMLSKITSTDLRGKLFLDPCCGSGNYLIQAIRMGFEPQNVYGFDIDPNAVKITRQRIKELCGFSSENIQCADFLEIAPTISLKVDYIFTNPPWGKKLNKSVRNRLVSTYCAGRSSDTSALFLFAALSMLKSGGQIGFLLQEAFFNIGSFADARRRLSEINIEHFIDYGHAFRGLLTKAQAFIATNRVAGTDQILCKSKSGEFYRSRSSFRSNPNLIYNFRATASDGEVIEHLFNLPHSTLVGRAKWGLGIVTGDNNRWCYSDPCEGRQAIYRGVDLLPNGFREPSLFVDSNLSQYQQSAPREAYESPCKIVYKFITSRLCFACDREQRLLLNSANFLILNGDFPIEVEAFVRFLNCNFTNWLFSKIFSTHKILRGDLESLPIFFDYFENGKFCEDRYLELLKISKTCDGSYVVTRYERSAL